MAYVHIVRHHYDEEEERRYAFREHAALELRHGLNREIRDLTGSLGNDVPPGAFHIQAE
jgi:hypothetical protein